MRAAPAGTQARSVARWLLGVLLAFAGVSHFARPEEFLAQVPSWVPAPDAVVAVSGVVEIVLAVALVAARRHRAAVGWTVAAFFVAIFPGNIWQYLDGTDAFGLDSDAARAVRLLVQPMLVVWALWCTGAWRAWRDRRSGDAPVPTGV